jgi:hypothetical protein
MVEKKRVRFANTAGKPLVQIREINKEGKGRKIASVQTRRMPEANLSKMLKKHTDAVRRAQNSVAVSTGKVEYLKRQMNFEKGEASTIKNEMSKQMKKKSLFGQKKEVEHLKNQLEESEKLQQTYMRQMTNAKMELNLAKNKLAAQKSARM